MPLDVNAVLHLSPEARNYPIVYKFGDMGVHNYFKVVCNSSISERQKAMHKGALYVARLSYT